MKPIDVLRLSEPLESMYASVTSDLLVNMSRHLWSNKPTELQKWQVERLAEIGKLTRESAAIIARGTGQRVELVESALEAAAGMSLDEVEATLQAAAKAGKIATAAGELTTSERVREVIKNLSGQAVDDMNLVNTVMLDSTIMRYRMAVIDVVSAEEHAAIETLQSVTNLAELEAQAAKSQKILNTAAGSVNLATETRQQAVRNAVKKMAMEGITGFIDAGGHHWTPEAYVNMDVRTTVHNTALQAQRARSADYGVTTFQVSTKAASRPLCAPYQGWICSWDNTGGTVEDLHGNRFEVHPIRDTSYGEPAGLFGINCGHTANTFVSGFSLARYSPPSKAEAERDAKEYELSQRQRSMERDIRKAKTEAAMYDAVHDVEAFEKAALKVKTARERYKKFCSSEDMTERTDRTQVLSYNRSVRDKVVQATRKPNK